MKICVLVTITIASLVNDVLSKGNFKIEWTNLDMNGDIMKDFAMQILSEEPYENKVCSPVTLLLPLAKLSLGATGQTLKELQKAIGMTREQVLTTTSAFVKNLSDSKGITLKMATNIFLSNKYQLIDSYKKDLTTMNATIEFLDFSSPVEASQLINKWVMAKTNKNINNVVNSTHIDKGMMMMLISVAHFKGRWQKRFKNVGPTLIFNSYNGPIKLEMMRQVDALNFKQSDKLNAKIIEIPYQGGVSDFVILMPNNRNGLPELLEKLRDQPLLLSEELKTTQLVATELIMPKFKMEVTLDPIPILKKMGINGIFDGPEMTKILQDAKAYLDKAIQKIIINVNEEGTMISSNTGVYFVPTVLEIPSQKIIVDHPFLFLVKVKGEQLFVGIYNGDLENVGRDRN